MASETTELTPPREGMKTREKIASSALRSNEKSRSMSAGGSAGLADGGSGRLKTQRLRELRLAGKPGLEDATRPKYH
jgi:hypothetical protein